MTFTRSPSRGQQRLDSSAPRACTVSASEASELRIWDSRRDVGEALGQKACRLADELRRAWKSGHVWFDQRRDDEEQRE
jgi:hypothetical protein